jgi:hypothetical protein
VTKVRQELEKRASRMIGKDTKGGGGATTTCSLSFPRALVEDREGNFLLRRVGYTPPHSNSFTPSPPFIGEASCGVNVDYTPSCSNSFTSPLICEGFPMASIEGRRSYHMPPHLISVVNTMYLGHIL